MSISDSVTSNSGADNQAYNYCALPLARYACRPDQSLGRIVEEGASRHRTAFQRDRDRIIHSTAFRRLKYKTQVFVYHEGDHYRTRLTHTIEVAQIARTLARALMVNEDLAEGVALAHDLGHTPFAHMGEESLKVLMENLGGFDHNDQSLRVLTHLEHRYPQWLGLNLTWESLEGVAKHNGPLLLSGQVASADILPATLLGLTQSVDLRLHHYASVEAQVAGIADDIAYNNHDVEDGLRANYFTLEEIAAAVPLIGRLLKTIRQSWPDLPESLLVHELVREMMGEMVDDVLRESRKRLKELSPQSVDDVRLNTKQCVSFSEEMHNEVEGLRAFLFAKMYRHYKLNRIWLKVERIIGDLFHAFMNKHGLLPDSWQKRIEDAGGFTNDMVRARIVADYIAGMTDRYAIREHERLFDLYWDLK